MLRFPSCTSVPSVVIGFFATLEARRPLLSHAERSFQRDPGGADRPFIEQPSN